ncbi:DUF4398 domain-containing protein [Pseudomonas sp. NBRC 100443]|uniref:DUF4398 domain-containing protein n=1 Tax=Pseudomonas sp. NBRC 100443 TaxID=1113665 RepID=UPI00249FD110|nr:DUF4398 domain-containing protein [Pseudomonas sp. NBRC 100443]GLU42238.1 hypothetical protein Pssp01_63310 [Pseudomonas sp. NBRC 100443]
MTLPGLLLCALAGCANDPLPNEQMRLTEQALDQARAVGATDEVAEFKLAEDKYQAAREALAGAANKRARQLTEQAELDARLAEAKVLTGKSAAQLAEQGKSIQRLRRQLGEVK